MCCRTPQVRDSGSSSPPQRRSAVGTNVIYYNVISYNLILNYII